MPPFLLFSERGLLMQKPQIPSLWPVCGFHLDFEPWRELSPADEICPCCGIQFGYDDGAEGKMDERLAVYAEWRRLWIEAGMPWRSKGRNPPED